ncbi:ATP-binding protein [Alkalimonas collagenimarina]|uniref:histidine kinase n=1 Tax=Alkalimonas collagenimarina TaxID=400390 RepID=A0ABT9GXN5_9GAMM|nr:ATP-binding protein [Alkalimonas collagenimarina]MDP4535815.1 ATP-binding protein [Alkalimonas collagenimarina]
MIVAYTSLAQYWSFSWRQLWFFSYICSVGLIANLLALDLPYVAPLLLGNTAFLVILLRLGPFWGVASLALVTLPCWGSGYMWLSVAEFSLIMLGWWLGFRHIKLLFFICWGTLAPFLLLYYGIWLQMSPAQVLLNVLVLVSTGALTLIGAQLILNVVVSSKQQQRQHLAEQLAGRITVFSAAPTLVLISAALHVFVGMDLARHHNQLIRFEERFSAHSSQQLLRYRDTLQQLAWSYQQQPDAELLQHVLWLQPHFISAAVTDASGDVLDYRLRGESRQISGVNVADRPYFQQLQLKPAGTFVSDVFQGRGIGENLLFAVSAPLLNEQQEFAGIVQASVMLSSVVDLQPEMIPDRIWAVLLDNQDHQVWATPPSDSFGRWLDISVADYIAGETVFNRSWLTPIDAIPLNQLGSAILRHYQTDEGWLMILRYHLDTHLMIYNGLTLLVIGLAMLALWLLNQSAYRFVRFFIQPLQQLIESMKRFELQSEAPYCDISQKATAIEFQQLVDEYNAMALRLHQAGYTLEELNASLESRVKSRTEELAAERDRATELAGVKSRFLATMSHELRTPLTAIIGYSEQLLQQARLNETKWTNTELEQINTILRNSMYLLDLVNDILDAAKLDEGKMAVGLEPVAITAMLQEVCRDMQKQAELKQLSLSLQLDDALPDRVLTDPLRLRQIMLNLLGNAIKFTEQGGIEVLVSLTSTHRMQISVIDTGIGMSLEQLETVFSAFEQADGSTSRQYGGTGLGLHISYQLAELLQGELSVSSVMGEGSRFILELPVIEPDSAERSQVQDVLDADVLPTLIGKLLVVDDVPDIRRLVVGLMELTGLTIIEAENGQQALEQCQAHEVDLVLMDMNMPVMDGMEATRQLRASGFDAPIVALTADVLPEDKAVFLQAGCSEVLTKPIRRSHLYQTVQRLLAESQQSGPASTAEVAATMSSTAMITQLRQQYIAQLPAQYQQLTDFLKAEERRAALDLLHKIKGTAGSFGLDSISQQAASIEHKLKADAEIDPEMLAVLEEQIAAAQST